MAPISVRQAMPGDAATVAAILAEAAAWLEQAGMAMWRRDEVAPERIAAEVEAGHFYLGLRGGVAVATVKFQLEDPEFWPDAAAGEAVYIHRLAVRRAQAGSGAATMLMRWAAERGRALGRGYLRLDCEATRPRLRAVYERFGFVYRSDRRVGPYHVARYEYALNP